MKNISNVELLIIGELNMKIKSILTTMLVVLISIFSMIGPCYAARIYNNVSFTVGVQGIKASTNEIKEFIVINPGERSESLSWKNSSTIVVNKDNGDNYCSLFTSPFNQIQGGNYMIIGTFSNCYICDSDHEILEGAGEC